MLYESYSLYTYLIPLGGRRIADALFWAVGQEWLGRQCRDAGLRALWEANATSNMCWVDNVRLHWILRWHFHHIKAVDWSYCSLELRFIQCLEQPVGLQADAVGLTTVFVVFLFDAGWNCCQVWFVQVIWIWDAKFWYFCQVSHLKQLLTISAPNSATAAVWCILLFSKWSNEAFHWGTKDVEASDDPEKGVTTCHLTCHRLGGKCLGSKMHIQHPYIWRGEPKVVYVGLSLGSLRQTQAKMQGQYAHWFDFSPFIRATEQNRWIWCSHGAE